MLVPRGDFLISVWLHACDDQPGEPLGQRASLIAAYGDRGRWRMSYEPFTRPDMLTTDDVPADTASEARRYVLDTLIYPTTLSAAARQNVRTLEVQVMSSDVRQIRRSVLEGVLGPVLARRPKVML